MKKNNPKRKKKLSDVDLSILNSFIIATKNLEELQKITNDKTEQMSIALVACVNTLDVLSGMDSSELTSSLICLALIDAYPSILNIIKDAYGTKYNKRDKK